MGTTRAFSTWRAAALALTVFALSGALVSCRPGAPTALVASYLGARPVTPTWNLNLSPAEPMWSWSGSVDGVGVTISARCCIGEGFFAQYADERAARMVFSPGDYVYPTELRVGADQRTVYGRASGLAGGLSAVTKIFAYDLAGRRLLESAEVSPSLLPAPMAPDAERPVR